MKEKLTSEGLRDLVVKFWEEKKKPFRLQKLYDALGAQGDKDRMMIDYELDQLSIERFVRIKRVPYIEVREEYGPTKDKLKALRAGKPNPDFARDDSAENTTGKKDREQLEDKAEENNGKDSE